MNLKNKLSVLTIWSLILVTVACFVQLFRYFTSHQMSYEINKEIRTIVTNRNILPESEPSEFSHESWDDLKSINDDFIGYLVFDDGYIQQAVVQADDNDYYLQHDFYRRWNLFGAIYMDSENETSSQNITIYGHNVFFTDDQMFSPLAKLTDQEQYQKHKEFHVYYENDVAYYRIRAVYYYDIDADRDFDYRQQAFSFDEFKEYIAYAYSHSVVNTDSGSGSEPERIMTLQTCKDLNSNIRILFLCTEERRTEYS